MAGGVRDCVREVGGRQREGGWTEKNLRRREGLGEGIWAEKTRRVK